MPNRAEQYYVGDEVTLRGTFKKNGVEQTPDAASGLIEIWKVDVDTAFQVSTAAVISGNEITYKTISLTVGRYVAYITATFNTAVDKRTGVIDFIVKKKEAH